MPTVLNQARWHTRKPHGTGLSTILPCRCHPRDRSWWKPLLCGNIVPSRAAAKLCGHFYRRSRNLGCPAYGGCGDCTYQLSVLVTPEQAWHRRARRQRQAARGVLAVERARRLLSSHHGRVFQSTCNEMKRMLLLGQVTARTRQKLWLYSWTSWMPIW